MDALDLGAQAYREELQEHLESLEQELLDLESDPGNAEIVNRVFRSMHTIKGGASMFGFDEIARLTHDIETVFDRIRSGSMSADKSLLDLTLEARDHLRALAAAHGAETPELLERSGELISRYRAYLGIDSEQRPTKEQATAKTLTTPTTYWVRYAPNPSSFLSGVDPLNTVEEIVNLGQTSTVFHDEDVPELDSLNPEECHGVWDILLNSDRPIEELQDVFIFNDKEEFHIASLCVRAVRANDLDHLRGLLREHGDESIASIESVLSECCNQMITGKFDKKAAPPPAPEVKARPRGQQAPGESHASIRVDSDRLDRLVNMVGEMVILQSRLSIASRKTQNPVISQIAEEMERLTVQMRQNALGMRMLPIGTVFGSLRRLVRDVSNSLGKQVEFVTEGEDTELDKTVIDRLKDPLMHILRNSLDHGIESSEDRVAAGKTEQGLIHLAARHSRGEVLLEIRDDGKGIDLAKLRAKAIEKGILSEDDILDDKECLNLIFAPGFSTATAVSDLSGRGVGMDVVRRAIDSLRGSVEVASELGKGSALTIRLPLTLAIIDGLNVLVGEESYILPLLNIEACMERFPKGDTRIIETIEHMGHMVPCLSLRQLLRTPGQQPDYERIVLVNIDDQKVGLAVDAVVGRQQAVIKSLSDMYHGIDFISGTTINGHGSISLILDVQQLVRSVARGNGNAGKAA